jgi:hypothetical protein
MFLVAKELLLLYRIEKGLFGTNEHEARALIDFITRNADKIDFTGGDGKLRKVLLPEAQTAQVSSHVPVGVRA